MSAITILVLFCISAVILKLIVNKWKYYKIYWSLPGPFAFPLIGNALPLLFCDNRDMFTKMVDIISQYPSPMRLWIGPTFFIIFKEPDQITKILSSNNFLHKSDIYKLFKEFVGEGLITGSGPKWRRDRKLMSPLFTKNNVEKYFSCICDQSKILVEKLENKVKQPSFDVETYIHRCTVDSVNESVMGIKTNAQSGKWNELLNATDRLYDIIAVKLWKPWLQNQWIFKLTHYWKHQQIYKKITDAFLRKVITEAIELRPSSDETILDQLLNIRNKFPNFASVDELIHHVATLYLASEDPITIISSFTLLVLGMYPDIQDKVVKEIKLIVGDRTNLDLEDIYKMDYLQMCINEILRLFPIAPFIVRKSADNFQIDNFIIPKGCNVLIDINHIQRNPDCWEKPEEFYPEHFLPNAVTKRHPFAFIPFSAGGRGCLGRNYAYMAIKIILVSVLQKYIVFADGKVSDIKLQADISVRPRGRQFPIRIDKRK